MAQHRGPLPRLNIPQPLSMQQPMTFDRGQPMYSPALPTSLQHSFHPPFSVNNSMQTPMQSYFTPQPPPAPGRPTHHQAQASIVQLAASGILPPNRIPITPVGGHFSRPSMMIGPAQPFGQHGGGPPFPNRNRRQLSIGGPPKAILGGPAKRHTPLPPQVGDAPPAAPPKPKKVTVNLPRETIAGDDGEPRTRPSWARTPLDAPFTYKEPDVVSAELTTAELFPSDDWRHRVPGTIDVFLPGKRAWDAMKQQAIEEKLERLGVERGSGSTIPHIHAPHARAASISSPADPALLFFKLNKLQESQTTSSTNSLSTSPQPPFGLSPSPHHQAPRFVTNRHGHSMSLAQPTSQSFLNFHPANNPFGPSAVLGGDQVIHRSSPKLSSEAAPAPGEGIHAPQGRVPVAVSSLAPPLSNVRSDSRPDFIRGFGLDIPEEDEADEDLPQNEGETSFVTGDGDASREDNTDDTDGEEGEQPDGMITASQSRFHSRHVSRLSVALSLRSVGGLMEDVRNTRTDLEDPNQSGNVNADDMQEDMDLEDAVEEWTGSEDLYMGETSEDDQSIGEWSNPSDEERARQQRVDSRVRRRAAQQELETPRRLPNFPRPPDNTMMLPRRRGDDIISNPSEEEHLPMERREEYLGVESSEYYSRPPSNIGMRSPRPLPPLPHSRVPSSQLSGQLSAHDPAQAHSRAPSNHFEYPSSHHPQYSVGQRRDSLNPFAKPFVFGAPRESSGSWVPNTFNNRARTPPKAPLLGHTRLPSFGKPLNAAAQEFTPVGFNFRPPPGVPQMTFPMPEPARPLPEPPVGPSPIRKQGREKRQRRGSSASFEEEGDSMSSFRFPPNPESPQSIRRVASPGKHDSRSHSSLNPSAEPFTFAGVSASLPFVPKESVPLPHSLIPQTENSDDSLRDDSTAKAEDGGPQLDDPSGPSNSKPKRPPIPLDFKHPVSQNTVPAGLFKALISTGDERTRRTVRSRLGSREVFEHVHRPSLDDLNMPSISHKISRSRVVTHPGDIEASSDVFRSTRHSRRQSSLPDALHSAANSSISGVSIPAMDLPGRTETQQYEMLASLLDEKFSAIRHDLANMTTNGQSMGASTENMISEVLSLFRTQLQESATRSLEDSRMDARGELDFELIKDVINQGQAESRALLQREFNNAVQWLGQIRASGEVPQDMKPLIEQVSNRTTSAVIEAFSELAERLEAIGHAAPARERHVLVDELVSALTPVLASLRAETVDYDLLTNKLTQSVKPHISQLIDLASDKRETAGLIVDKILPLLSPKQSSAPALDTDAITLQLTTEVRRAIAPIDAFEIKEQVADLVVERLDSRLAVRDKTFNIETVAGKVTEAVTGLLEPMQNVTTILSTLVEGQQTLSTKNGDLLSVHKNVINIMSELPSKLTATIEALDTVVAERRAKPDSPVPKDSQTDETTLNIKSTVEQLASDQKALVLNNEELLSLHRDVLGRLNTLPETLAATDRHLDFASQDASKRELEELRKLNADYQIQLAKARGAHGQVRVEKDVLSDKLSIAEGDRDQLRAQVKELQTSASQKATEVATVDARNSELEDALSKALARLQASDVATQANQERIAELAKINRELLSEKQILKSKADSLDLQVTFATRDKDTAIQSLAVLQTQHDHLSSQQSHWDDLRRASEQIETLTALIGQADNEEVKELRRIRDRSKVLEGENAALQKRLKEQESKMTNNERAALTARQSLAQAQQRASEWERRAKEYEGQLEQTQTKLDQAEQTQAQLDADYSLVNLQLEEREADDRLAKDRENKIRDQVANLEAQVARLQAELDQAKAANTPTTAVPPAYRKITNGNIHTPRPDSRASTIYGDSRSVTPNRLMQSQRAGSDTPPQASVWDSMHAPNVVSHSNMNPPSRYSHPVPTTPKARRQYYPPSIPSPTPSTVSLALTQGEDGWWS